MNFKKLLNMLKKEGDKNKNINNIIIIILIGILLIIATSFFKGDTAISTFSNTKKASEITVNNTSSNGSEDSQDISAYESDQENKLKALLQSIQGVGDTKVMIYFGSGEEEVPAYNENKSSSVINETDNSGGKRTTTQNNSGTSIVLENDGEKTKPFILKTYKPKVTGILISAEGADDSDIRLNITNAVASFFDISADKVNVYPMKK